MRKHTITIYSNDEYTFWQILKEVNIDITKEVFDRENIRKRKFSGTLEQEKDCDSPNWRYMGNTETIAKWESNVVSESEFRRFQT